MNADPSAGRRLPLLDYLGEYRAHRGRVGLAAFLALVKHSPVIVLPAYTAYLIDVVIPARDKTALALCAVGMASVIMVNMALHPLFIRLFSAARRDVALRLRAKLCERIQQLVFAWTDSASSGRLHSKVMADVEKLDTFGRILIDPLLVTACTILVSLGLIIWMQPLFALVFLGFMAVLLIHHRMQGGRVKKQFNLLRIEQERLNADVSEMIGMLTLSRAHGTEDVDLRKLTDRLGEVRRIGVRTDWIQHLIQAQLWSGIQLASIAVAVLGAFLVIGGGLSVGEMVFAMTLIAMSLGGVMFIVGQMEQFYGANEAMRSIHEVLTAPQVEDNAGKPAIPVLHGRVEFRDVWFTYPGAATPVLKSLSLTCESDTTVALVGASGAGKTTFMKLLLGFYDPLQGAVLVDDVDLRTIDRRTLRRQVGVVTQETFLFNGTIRQNLVHGLGDLTQEQVDEAARQAHAHDFILETPAGYDTEIGDRGLRLSGGQRQRLAIARALLRNPRLLLLDEATSSLDSESERAVQKALESLMRGRTTFVIAHRLSTVRNADRILVFDDGRIVEDGRHDLLLSRGGVYARLVELQAVS